MVLRSLPVSMIIATRDRPQALRQAVQSILAGDSLPMELIVADQSAGEPGPLPVSGEVEIRHLRLSSVGQSRACNAGIAAARHDALVFTDDDVLVERDWLRRLVESLLARSERTVVTGSVLLPQNAELDGHVPSLTDRTEAATFSGRLFEDVLYPQNMALRRRAFDEVGLFDERLGPGSPLSNAADNDLCYRLLEAGYEIAFVPDPIVYHVGARKGMDLIRLHWSYGRGQGAFYAKHTSLSDRHMLRRFKRETRKVPTLLRVLRGDRGAAARGIYLAGLISGALGWWRRFGRPSRAA